MSTKPIKPNLRYGQLKAWLEENGVSEYVMKALIAEGVIRSRKPWASLREAYYNAEEVQRDVLDRLGSKRIGGEQQCH